eukprot:scaffold82931_cov20-Tisochrysis_lutea.AAC.3
MIGMPAGSHFVLWSGDGDTTLGMRNALAYDMARATDNWAPRVQFCELFVIQERGPHWCTDHMTHPPCRHAGLFGWDAVQALAQSPSETSYSQLLSRPVLTETEFLAFLGLMWFAWVHS